MLVLSCYHLINGYEVELKQGITFFANGLFAQMAIPSLIKMGGELRVLIQKPIGCMCKLPTGIYIYIYIYSILIIEYSSTASRVTVMYVNPTLVLPFYCILLDNIFLVVKMDQHCGR